jgi:amino acid transporter
MNPNAGDKGGNLVDPNDIKHGKLNPELIHVETQRTTHPGSSYARVKRARHFTRVSAGYFVAKSEEEIPQGKLAHAQRSLKRLFIGRPLTTAEEGHQRLNKIRALAVFGSDAISSSAYATEASLAILIVAGNASLSVSLYTAVAIAILLSVVAFSYRQTVYAYPQGGGSYNVSSQNLGKLPGLVAASALLIDYVLTVSVSIVAGSQGVISALIVSGYESQVNSITASLPPYLNLTVMLSLFFIGLLTLGNLRGVREAGTIFAVPTYLFIMSISVMIVLGLIKSSTGTLHAISPPPIIIAAEPLTLWLVLRAFSAGAVAMSGTEAISNGVPVFKPPESKNAATTVIVMASLLGVFFLGISFLATHMGLVPGKETIISQIALAVFGHNVYYYIFQVATIGVLVVAANTAFADFPRLSSVLARDNYMPHQFQFRGDRLAFSTGIIFLGGIAALLVVAFEGNIEGLINLYAIGVFLAFTLSNSGMVVHWWKSREAGWKRSLAINGISAVLTFCILIIAIMTKFSSGGWMIVVIIPVIILLLTRIHRHYKQVGKELGIVADQIPPSKIEQLVLILVDDVNYASLRAFSFARTIEAQKVVLHISTNTERALKIKGKMLKYAPDLSLVVIESPTRSFIQPLTAYVDAIHGQSPTAFITIVLPEFIAAHFWEKFLHNRTAERLRGIFEKHPNVTLIMVPYLLEKKPWTASADAIK